ncbi:OmpA family protein [Pseudonocardia xishanensis]|uniref:OmpA-like domain-containing protein n=1 Tax=Pseudonocardia xishanensis TaxID=630995 RepID=A0ABP8S341_9PSEU
MSVRRRAALFVLAAVAVPAALAGVGMLWVRPATPPVPVASPAVPGASPTSTTAGPPTQPVVAPVAARVAGMLAADPLLFDGERAELRPAVAATVDRIAALLVAEPAARVRLVGHTADLPGPPARAVVLSRQRAEAVAARLVAAGIDPARITVDGAGETAPLATPEASRRVEVVLG